MFKKTFKKHRTRNHKVKKHRTRNHKVKKHRTRNHKVKKHRTSKNKKGGYNYNGWPIKAELAMCNNSNLNIHPGCKKYCCDPNQEWANQNTYTGIRCYNCNRMNEFNRPQSP